MYGVWNRWMSSEKHETWNMKEKHEREAWMRSMNALVMARQEDLWIVKYIWIMESIDVWIMELCQAWICHMKYGFWNYDTILYYLYLYLYLYGVVSIDCKREDSIWQQHIDITHPIPSIHIVHFIPCHPILSITPIAANLSCLNRYYPFYFDQDIATTDTNIIIAAFDIPTTDTL